MSFSDTPYEIELIEDIAGTNPADDNIDVVVRFAEGTSYAATFFTLQNIQTLMERYASSGECLSGLYIWSTRMIIVRQLDRQTIEAAVQDLIAKGEFEDAFEGPAKDE